MARFLLLTRCAEPSLRSDELPLDGNLTSFAIVDHIFNERHLRTLGLSRDSPTSVPLTLVNAAALMTAVITFVSLFTMLVILVHLLRRAQITRWFCVDVIHQFSSCKICTLQRVVHELGLRHSGILYPLLSRGAGCCQTRVWRCALTHERRNVCADALDLR